jgi:uncharacterized protein YecA (UPF0149 family)
MATEAQFNANRENAQHSTGPRTTEGRARSSQNALRFGLFSAKNCVQPGETEEYDALSTALWDDMRPQGTLEAMFATEVIRAAWRLRRCAEVEATLADKSTEDPMLDQDLLRTQTAVDRARSQAHGIMRRSLAELRRLQSDRPKQQSTEQTEIKSAAAKPTRPEAPIEVQIPRCGPCPCGSGQKYKRCCAKNAPGVLHQAA